MAISSLKSWLPGLLALIMLAPATASAQTTAPATPAASTTAEPRLPGSGRILRVGKTRTYLTVADAARDTRDGDVVEIDAGEYYADVAVWTQRDLVIRGVGGLATLVASGQAAERKAIWVIRGENISVENIGFRGARVPDRNGAGIRLERGRLTVRDCVFEDNENGILTGNENTTELTVERSSFLNNGSPDGYAHQLYAGQIKRLTVTGSYFRLGRIGHLLKSRAAESDIRYNRLTDESGGTASYELEFPAGGRAVAIGNLIQQSSTTDNPTIVSFGAEGYKHTENRLVLAHNTIVNDRAQGGTFVFVAPGGTAPLIVNNIFVGSGDVKIAGSESRPDSLSRNSVLNWDHFAQAVRLDYRLVLGSAALGKAVPITDEPFALRPTHEYVHPASIRPLPPGLVLSPGAFQAPAPAK
jgi:hypothetical protein